MTEELEKRVSRAHALHAEGYSCSQCVLMSHADRLGIDSETAARIGAGLGAGVSCGEICGVASALAIGVGMLDNSDSHGSKLRAMPGVRELLRDFAEPMGGCLTCRDLKGKCGRSCDALIEDGVRLLDRRQ